jgi:Putative restriction endonuclease
MQATIEPVVTAMRSEVPGVAVRYPVQTRPDAWVLPEGTVPESIPHDAVAQRLKLLLEVWAARLARPATVARNLAVRWLETSPSVGIDPDVCVLDPPPPGVNELGSLCLWKPGHAPPTICFEVVSRNHPHKDYSEIQDRYALVGTRELVVFDPFLAGPKSLGGPLLLQVWRRDRFGVLERVHAGDSPAASETLGAWLIPTTTTLEIADDREGNRRWLNWEELAVAEQAATERERAEKERERAEKEHERAEKERERAEKERERAARLELERRIAEIEAKVGGR